MPKGTLFSNSQGDQIFFDGWNITSVKGLGSYRVNLNIRDQKSNYEFSVGTNFTGSLFCENWIKIEKTSHTLFSRDCGEDLIYSSGILVKNDGGIKEIRQIVDNKYTLITLSKLK